MANILVAQGSLNRLRASLVWTTNPSLNVVSAYLGREGIRLSLEGNATDYLPTMIGAVPSPAPYQIATVTINLIKSQQLANLYKNQFETDTLLGDLTVRPDAVSLGLYTINNAVLESVREMTFAGEDPTFVVTCKGYYLTNAAYFNQ